MSTECCTPADALLSPSGGGRELCVRKYVRTYVRYIRTYVREITAPPSPDDLRLAGRLVHEDMGTVHLHDDVLLLQSLVLPPPPPPQQPARSPTLSYSSYDTATRGRAGDICLLSDAGLSARFVVVSCTSLYLRYVPSLRT